MQSLPRALTRATTFPLLPIQPDGSCGCRAPDCKDAGKHPAIKWGRKSLADGTQVPIPPGYGRGLATGARSGVVVLDIDAKDGKPGFASLERLYSGHEGDLATLTSITPTNGAHLFYAHPGGVYIPNSASVLGDGLDVRADGGYVVTPESPHKRGGAYRWVNVDAPIAPLPSWLLQAMLTPPRKPRKISREELFELAGKWSRSRSPVRKKTGDALRKVCEGIAFAAEGNRNDTAWALVSSLAHEYPDAQVDTLAALFAPSLQLMGEPTEDQLDDMFTRAFASVPQWHVRLVTTDTGLIKPCLGNTITVLRNEREWKSVLAFDERKLQSCFIATPPTGAAPGPITDADAANVATWFTETKRIPISAEVSHQALVTVARDNTFDPFADYLESLQWDGKPRLDSWLTVYAGVDATDYVEAVGAAWLVSLVARTLEPGCKVDTMPILEGDQGMLKSTLCAELVGREYFCDHLPDINNKDAFMQLQGPAIIEVAELASFSRKESETIKAFLSRRVDRFRAPYGRSVEEHPRRCILVGTTNAKGEHYFVDHTGGRRFWPLKVEGKCDIDGLRRDRGQLLAEAVVRFKAGAQWWLGEEHEALARAEQESRQEQDSWAEVITNGLLEVDDTSTAFVLEHILFIPKGQWTRSHEIRVGRVLRQLGFAVSRPGTGPNRVRRYVRSNRPAAGSTGAVVRSIRGPI